MKLDFVEKKRPDYRRVEELLAESAAANRWANRGPLYDRLSDALAAHMNLPPNLCCVLMANAGTALEAMARLKSERAGRTLRWAACAFSFRNLGRGYFHDVQFIDCGSDGLLDLEKCATLDRDTHDGLILTVPFGLETDLDRYIEFAETAGLELLIDNASGMQARAPQLAWQAFSLHHTKPYGVGEGGFAVVEKEDANALYELVDYASDKDGSADWLGNGKISDVSSAFQIDRLERADEWTPHYLDQRARVIEIAKTFGAHPLVNPPEFLPMTSVPLVMPAPISLEVVSNSQHLTLAKYYKPLKPLPVLSGLFAHLVNVPSHPDVAELSDAQIRDAFDRMLRCPSS